MPRQALFGIPFPPAPSRDTYAVIQPTGGWNSADPIVVPQGSMVSGQNVWVVNESLRPRDRLSQTTYLAPLASTGSGTELIMQAPIDDRVQNLYAFEGSGSTYRYWRMNGGNSETGDTKFTVVADTGTPANNQLDPRSPIFSADVWDETNRTAVTCLVDGASVGITQIGAGSTSASTIENFIVGTNYEYPRDIIAFDDSPIVWGAADDNAREFKNVVIWPVGTDFLDWSGTGSGHEELRDMRGSATRAFVMGERMILASTQELWEGRFVGGSFRFLFRPVDKKIGIPLRRAAINTPLGIFWLNSDFMVYHFDGAKVSQVGQPIINTLRAELALDSVIAGTNKSSHFMTYDSRFRTVTLHYSTAAGVTGLGADRAFTLHIDERAWTPQRFSTPLQASVDGSIDMFTSLSNTRYNDDRPKTTYYTTSRASIVQWDSSASRDAIALPSAGDPQRILVTSQWVSGGMLTSDPLHTHLFDEVRVESRADLTPSEGASTVSVALSADLGGTYATEQSFTPSVASASSQNKLNFGQSGRYGTVALRSDQTGWYVNRIIVRAKQTGSSE